MCFENEIHLTIIIRFMVIILCLTNTYFVFCLKIEVLIILHLYYHIVHIVFTNSLRFHKHLFKISTQTKTYEQTFSFLNVHFYRFTKKKIHNIDTNCFKILNCNRICWSEAIPDFYFFKWYHLKTKTFDSRICVCVCVYVPCSNIFFTHI